MKKILYVTLLLIAFSKASELASLTKLEVVSPWQEFQTSLTTPLTDMTLEELRSLRKAFDERDFFTGGYNRYLYVTTNNEVIYRNGFTGYSDKEIVDIVVQSNLMDKHIKEKSAYH